MPPNPIQGPQKKGKKTPALPGEEKGARIDAEVWRELLAAHREAVATWTLDPEP